MQSDDEVQLISHLTISDDEDTSTFNNLDPDTFPFDEVLNKIKLGNLHVTLSVANLSKQAKSGNDIRCRLVKEGLLSILLELLSHCDDGKTLLEVFLAGGGDDWEGGIGDDAEKKLVTGPELWVGILSDIITHPSEDCEVAKICMDIAVNIQPLMKCVFEKEEVFKSNDHWKTTKGMVLNLITNLGEKNVACLPILLRNEGEKIIRECIFKDIKDINDFEALFLGTLGKMVFHHKKGIPNDTLPMPDDTMFAHAICAGLIQMCLKMLVRFGNTGNDESLIVGLEFILQGAIASMFNDQTSKAIAHVYADVVQAVKDADVRALALENSKYEKVVQMVLHIVGTNIESFNKTTDGDGYIICNTCELNLEVEGRAIKRCGGCKKVTYCSVKCQKADWPSHKKHCTKRIVDPKKHDVMNLGAAVASQEKMAVHSENVLQAAQEVFSASIDGMLHHANASGLKILDCFVIIDFRNHLPHTRVMTPSEFINDDDYWGANGSPPQQMQTFLAEHHGKNKAEGLLLALCLTVPPRDKPLASGMGSIAVTPAPFPGSFFPGGWPAYQEVLKRN